MPSISFDHEEFVVDYQMNIFRQYLIHLETLFEDEFRNWDDAVETRAQKIPDETDRQEFYDYMSEDYFERLAFRHILLNSFFAASFAMFEHRLCQHCYHIQNYLQSSCSVDDLRISSRMDRADKYLRGLGVPFPNKSNLWKEIKRYQEMRNRIMHEGGRIRPTEELYRYARKHGIVSPHDGLHEIRLTKDFCDQAVDSMKKFLLEAIDSYNRWRTEQS